VNLTLNQIATALGRMDGRDEPNAEDWRLARIAKPHLDKVTPEEFHQADVALGFRNV
jgi:hypothetical protein